MKQGLTRTTVILIVLGVILFADVVVFFDSASGFLAGNALWRYLLFALGLVSIWLFSRARSKTVSGAAVPVSRVKTAAAAASAARLFLRTNIRYPMPPPARVCAALAPI